MEETLGGALAALFKESAPASAVSAPNAGALANVLAREALGHYDRALERLKAGDWAGFGVELDALGPLLQKLGAGGADHPK